MQAHRVNELQRRLLGEVATEPQARHKPRIALHTTSGFDRGPSRHDLSALNPEKKQAADAAIRDILSQKPKAVEHRFPSGVVIIVPGLPDAIHSQIQRVFSRVSPERRAQLERLSAELATELYEGVPAATDASGAALQQHNTETFEQHVLSTVSDQHSDMVSDTIYAGMYGVEKQLYDFFNGVRQKQELANDVRADLAELQEMIAEWPDDGSAQSFTYRELVFGEDGSYTVVEKQVTLTKQEAIALAERLRLSLQGVGEISVMDQLQLQRMVHQYQQGINAFSNILKQQDEVLRGTIQNIKA